jgi:hypothetical protein
MAEDPFWRKSHGDDTKLLSSVESWRIGGGAVGGGGGGAEGGLDFFKLGRLITSSTSGVIICQDIAISAVAPYKLSSSVLEYRTSAEPISTLS